MWIEQSSADVIPSTEYSVGGLGRDSTEDGKEKKSSNASMQKKIWACEGVVP